MRNTELIKNIYEEKKVSSKKLSTQLLYGENFTILKSYTKWLKIKCQYDNYIGYILNKNYASSVLNTHKVNKLKVTLYKNPKKFKKTKKKISFCSLIKVTSKKNNFYKFDNYWIRIADVNPINKKMNIFSNIKIFTDVKYKWGGLSFKGIDCSALVQIFYKYNNKYCPRDSINQLKFFKGVNKKFKKYDLIFWKGNIAICINKNQLIHAYGPKKKVIIMNIKKTIIEIKKNVNLQIIKTINDI